MLQRLALDCALLTPDCDGDGVFDTCQILADGALDLDGASLLDICLPRGTWHVDPNASTGGDGSPSAPFRTILEGVQAAADGDTVLLADGLYSGTGNKNITLTRRVEVRSQNGPETCVIDLEGSGRAFLVNTHDVLELRFAGLTIERASNSSILLGTYASNDIEVLIESCVFRDNQSSSVGAALALTRGRTRVRDCIFLRNEVLEWSHARGGAIEAGGALELFDCRFEDNRARFGGAVAIFSSDVKAARVQSCVFTGNEALIAGGAISHAGSGALAIANCSMVGNSAPRGGVLDLTWAGSVALEASTLLANHAAKGSVLHISDGGRAHISNSILWGNTSIDGALAQLTGAGSGLEIAYSTLERGPVPPVRMSLGATLTWGGGNLSVDPQLVAAGSGQLSALSPCIDAGSNPQLTQDAVDLDGDGLFAEPIPFDLAGAPRLVDDPAVPDAGVGAGPVVDHGAYERQP